MGPGASRTATLVALGRYRTSTLRLLISADTLPRLPVSRRDIEIPSSAEGATQMIAVAAFASFALLVAAWFVAPSKSEVK